MNTPLAFRIRPTSLSEIIGQEHLVGEQGFLTSCLEHQTLVSMIFYGPPGVGKTTLAAAFAQSMKVHYLQLNAVTSSKKDIETAVEEAKMFESCIVIMDEVHRLNKDKQDLLLPFIEDGTIYLIGATTANPYISINPAVRSRCHLLEVKRLNESEVLQGLKRAISLPNGLNNRLHFSDAALKLLAKMSGGDMRFGLNYLEVLALSHKKRIDVSDIESVVRVPNILMDKDDNEHYDNVSALQKSIRGSDVDAALFYLARLCVAGDLESIERRLLVTAYEDIGLANPQAVDRTINALDSARRVGFPEAVIPLGFAVCDLALSPKSKAACEAVHKAMEIASSQPLDVMDYLRLTPVNVKPEDGYPYDRPDLWEKIQYLPNLIKDVEIYTPWNKSQYERVLNENYARLKKTPRSSNLSQLKKK